MRRPGIVLVIFLLVVGAGFGATLWKHDKPLLGLDLQGGLSVRLVPEGHPTKTSLNDAVDIIRNRVDALGVSEPDIRREGGDIVIDLPGVKNRQQALNLVGQTGQLLFRPVLAETGNPAVTTTTTPKKSKQSSKKSTKKSKSSTTVAKTTAAPTTTTTIPADLRPTPAKDDVAKNQVTLPGNPNDKDLAPVLFRLGSTTLTGKAISSAQAELNSNGGSGGAWDVNLKLTHSGLSGFNALSAKLFPNESPTNQVAIVLDGVVQSAPSIQPDNKTNGTGFQPFTNANGVQISGNFKETDAKNLARVLRYGALPLRFNEKQQTVENISPTLGRDQLHAGIASGLIGLLLVAIYMLLYYRLLGVVIIFGIGITGVSIYSLVSYLSATQGLTLSLSGVVGLIVSIGITVDSYVVYFERLKDELRSGKTFRSSLDRAFSKAWHTIVAADLVSLLGAGVLFFYAIGNVKGFALFLGLSTLLDLIVAYFFMQPLVMLLGKRSRIVKMPIIGMGAGLDAPGVEA